MASKISWQIQLFYNGLNGHIRTLIDVVVGETLMSKTMVQAHTLLKEMESNNYQFLNQRNMLRKVAGVH